jgi:hypothetical protein
MGHKKNERTSQGGKDETGVGRLKSHFFEIEWLIPSRYTKKDRNKGERK